MVFTTDWFSENIPTWAWLFQTFDRPSWKCLEIGSFEGRSTRWVLESVKNLDTITCVDTFEGSREHSDDLKNGLYERFIENIKPYKDKVIIKRGLSGDILKTLTNDTYDFIYVDGSHEAPDVLVDAVLTYGLLKRGGVIVFDDYNSGWEGVKYAVDAFLRVYSPFFQVVRENYQLALVKK